MSSSPAIRRLRKDYLSIAQCPTPGVLVSSSEKSILICHFILHGPIFHDTPFEGGVYHGTLTFPPNFPMGPPTIRVVTESGRFEPSKKICMSMSDFHPELWNPTWSVVMIIVGLASFWNSDEQTTGGVKADDRTRKVLAQRSLSSVMKEDGMLELFPTLNDIFVERAGFGPMEDGIFDWPPPRGVFDKTEVKRSGVPADTSLLASSASSPSSSLSSSSSPPLPSPPPSSSTSVSSSPPPPSREARRKERNALMKAASATSGGADDGEGADDAGKEGNAKQCNERSDWGWESRGEAGNEAEVEVQAPLSSGIVNSGGGTSSSSKNKKKKAKAKAKKLKERTAAENENDDNDGEAVVYLMQHRRIPI